jgi:hypothetical protein
MSSCFGWPRRRLAPAARTTAATGIGISLPRMFRPRLSHFRRQPGQSHLEFPGTLSSVCRPEERSDEGSAAALWPFSGKIAISGSPSFTVKQKKQPQILHHLQDHKHCTQRELKGVCPAGANEHPAVTFHVEKTARIPVCLSGPIPPGLMRFRLNCVPHFAHPAPFLQVSIHEFPVEFRAENVIL